MRARSPLTTLADRVRAYQARLGPAAFASHVTALRLYGTPVPTRWAALAKVDLSHVAPDRAPHARGIRGHRLTIAPDDLRWIEGIRVTSPTRAWTDSATQLDPAELVAAGDFLIHWERPFASREGLATQIERQASRRYSAVLMRAVGLLDDRAESFPESLLRMTLVRAGFPSPAVNAPLRVGGRTYRPDLAYPERRVLIEYQGDYHRDVDQWRADMRRRAALEAAGWTMIEVNWDDILDPGPLLHRLRELLA